MPSEEIRCYVEWEGLDEFLDLLENMTSRFEYILIDEYRKYGMEVEAGSRALAPEDGGDLASSINFSNPKRIVGGIMVEGGSNSVYALRRHEEPYRMGSFPKYDKGGKFPNYYYNGRGLTTQGKSWMGYPAGRKFMENAIKALEGYYNDMLERILGRVMRGGI